MFQFPNLVKQKFNIRVYMYLEFPHLDTFEPFQKIKKEISVRFEPSTSRSLVKHYITYPLHHSEGQRMFHANNLSTIERQQVTGADTYICTGSAATYFSDILFVCNFVYCIVWHNPSNISLDCVVQEIGWNFFDCLDNYMLATCWFLVKKLEIK